MSEQHVFYSPVHPSEGQRRYMLPGLDGLRAIAVLLVVVYHLWPAVLPGGMIGVDVFFVISGYLITALLMREGTYEGKISLVDFWKRRLRRLIPAVVVLVAVVGFFALIIGGDIQVGLGRQILGAFTYSSNWLYIASGHDYFAQTSPELLTNFWSLAVEEQFYVGWPILFVLACMFLPRWGQRMVLPAAMGLLSILLALIFTLTGTGLDRIYYGSDSHLYGLMLGVTLAFLIPWSMYPPSDRRLYAYIGYGNGVAGLVRALVGWVCLLGLLPLALVVSTHSPGFMPWLLLLSSLMAAGIIQALFADAQHPLSTALRWVLLLPPLVWIGRRSYGIYLWHWPVYVIFHYVFGPNASPLRGWVVLLLSFFLAGLSYMFVEQPVRELGFRGALRSWWASIMGGSQQTLARVSAGLLLLGVVTASVAVLTAPSMTTAQQVVAAGGERSVKIAPSASPTPSQAGASASPQPKTTSRATPAPRPTSTSSPVPSPAPGTFTQPVTVIGDSVTLASVAALQEKLPQASIDAEISRTITQGAPLLTNMADRGELEKYVVVSLTTNSTMNLHQLETLVSSISPQQEHRFIFVTGAAPTNLTWVANSNQAIYQLAQKMPETVFVADWAQLAAQNPHWLVTDGVHPQEAGQQAYAKLLADTLSQAASS